MQIALFATVLTLALASTNEYELISKNEDVATSGTSATVDSLPAALETVKSSIEKGSTDEAGIKAGFSSQIGNYGNKDKVKFISTMTVNEDNEAAVQEHQSSSLQSVEAKPGLTEAADVESSSRIFKNRFNRKSARYDEKRLKIIKKMAHFLLKGHPLSNLIYTVMKALIRLDEPKANEVWNSFGKGRRNFILLWYSQFVKKLVARRQHLFEVVDNQTPVDPNGPGRLDVLSSKSFDEIVMICEKLITDNNLCNLSAMTKLGSINILVFVEVLFDLIDHGKHQDAVEIDFFSPLYKVLIEVEKASCGVPSSTKHEKPLNDSCLQLIRDLKNDLEKVIPLITDDNREKPGFLMINRLMPRGNFLRSRVEFLQAQMRRYNIILAASEGFVLVLFLLSFFYEYFCTDYYL